MRRRKTYGKKLKVKKQFKDAMTRLRRMTPLNQRTSVIGASNQFIRDISSFLNRIRDAGHMLKAAHRNTLRRHKKKLRKLVSAKTPIDRKRLILSQKGGIAPILVPIIVALIGAGGSVGAAATHAAISKS